MNLFILILELKGYPILRAKKELENLKKLNSIDFNLFVETQKWNQFNYLFENNTFYRKFVGNKIINEWSDVPIVSKSDFQNNYFDLLTIGFKNNNLFKGNTSGSSGTPLYFAKDKVTHAKTWALNLDRYSRHKIIYGKSLQARFYGIPISGLKYYREKFKDFIAKRIRFPVFDLSDTKLDQFILKFKKHKFEYINGYTSSLVFFANYLIEKNIILKDICPSLKICFPTSEMCNTNDRFILEKGFGVNVANEYGCAEMDILAFEDENFDWIISNENIFFEIIDENNKVVDAGKSGRVVITSLYNRAMPMIRYEVGDMGILESIRKKQ